MTFNHKLIYFLYKLKSLFPNVFRRRNVLRVIIYHDIALEDYENFKKQILWLKRNYNIITPSEFEDYILRKRVFNGRNLLITFDDGFYSNFDITFNFLNDLNIKSIYFVIPDFVSIKDKNTVRNFISDRIFPGREVFVTDQMVNMRIENLKKLVGLGQTIGAHTKSHSFLSAITDVEHLKFELFEGLSEIENELGLEIKHFAYPFGTIESVNKIVVEYAKTRFKFFYTGMRGNNELYLDNYCILRDSVNPSDKIELLEAFLIGTADMFYKHKIEKYKNWNKY